MKYLKLLFFSLLFLNISCERSDIGNEIESTIQNNSSLYSRTSNISNLYYEIIKRDDTFDQLLIASALTPEEMYQMWLVKIDDYVTNNELNENQIFFFDNLKKDLSPAIFEENSKTRKAFDFNQLMTTAQNVLGENEGWYFLNKVENVNHRIAKLTDDSETTSVNKTSHKLEPIESCDCNKNSNCKRLTGISWIGISWENGTCSGATCYREKYLFGLIESSNNGRCVY